MCKPRKKGTDGKVLLAEVSRSENDMSMVGSRSEGALTWGGGGGDTCERC